MQSTRKTALPHLKNEKEINDDFSQFPILQIVKLMNILQPWNHLYQQTNYTVISLENLFADPSVVISIY